MKKIYQIGFMAALMALLPTGVLFAGDGDGDGKDTKHVVTLKNGGSGTESVTLTIFTTVPVPVGDVKIYSKSEGAYVKDVNPVVGGIQVHVVIDPSVNYENNNTGDVIIEIVGVDNITGIDATDGNTGNAVPTGLVAVGNKGGDENNNNQQDNSTSYHSNSSNPNVATSFTSYGKNDVNIYPNPVKDQTNVVTVGEILGKKIEVMDMSGHVVMNMIVGKGSRQTVLDLSMLTPGIYIISYETEDGQVISKKIQKI